MVRYLIGILILILYQSLTFAQSESEGEWQGQLKIPGLSLKLIIDLEKDDSGWKGTLDIPLQNISDMELAALDVTDSTLSFSLPEVPGSAEYLGQHIGDSISGTFTQAGQSMALVFHRVDGITKELIISQLDDLSGIIDSLLSKHHVPGMALSVVRDGEVILNQGFGWADVEDGRKVTSHTLFAIGSTTKAFTAAGLALLVDQQKLKWDDPISLHLPDFAMYDDFASKEMTALDLTTHRSGLPRHDLLWYGSDLSRMDLYHRLRFLEPTKSFRSAWQYQNLMYMTAGITIEKISGVTWEQFTADQIFSPLDMNRSNFSVELCKRDSNAALGYKVDENETFVMMDYRNIDQIGPAGSINSTSTDMAKWVDLLLNKGKTAGKTILSSDQIDFMHAPHMIVSPAPNQPEYTNSQYGTGWFIYDYQGSKVVQHGGNIDGFSALVFLLPEEKTGMTILVNKNGARFPGALANMIADIILQNPEPVDWMSRTYGDTEDNNEEEEKKDDEPDEDLGRKLGTSPTHNKAEYLGIYEHQAYQKIEVSQNEGQDLNIKINSFDLPLNHFHYNVFRAEDSLTGIDFKIQFHSDLIGSIDKLGILLEPSLDPILFEKKAPDQLSDPSFRNAVVGSYQVEDLKLSVKWENNNLVLSPQGQPNFILTPDKKNHFLAEKLKGYSIEFVFEGDKVTHAVLHQPNGAFKANKIEDDK